MPTIKTDAVLWYNVGKFGEAGYAVPNFSNDIGALNPQTLDLVDNVGRNLFHMMHHEDVDSRVPPSINTLRRIHHLYIRVNKILEARAVPSHEYNMETKHVQPAGEVYRVYPVPYFRVRNAFLRRWAGLVLMSLAEIMQHTEGRKTMEISTAFAEDVLQYYRRLYSNMAVEMFGKTRQDVQADGFLLSDQDMASYDPSKFFTQTERVDTVPPYHYVWTEDQIRVLGEGIPVTHLPAELGPWPTSLVKDNPTTSDESDDES